MQREPCPANRQHSICAGQSSEPSHCIALPVQPFGGDGMHVSVPPAMSQQYWPGAAHDVVESPHATVFVVVGASMAASTSIAGASIEDTPLSSPHAVTTTIAINAQRITRRV